LIQVNGFIYIPGNPGLRPWQKAIICYIEAAVRGWMVPYQISLFWNLW